MEMKQIKLWGYETKVQLKLLSKCCNVMVGCELFDVSVARWLLVPDEKIYSLRELVSAILYFFNKIDLAESLKLDLVIL